MKKLATLLAKTIANTSFATISVFSSKNLTFAHRMLFIVLLCSNIPLILYTLFTERYEQVRARYKVVSAVSMSCEVLVLVIFYSLMYSFALLFLNLAFVGLADIFFLKKQKGEHNLKENTINYNIGRCLTQITRGSGVIIYSGELVTIIDKRSGNRLLVRKFNGDEHLINAEYIDEDYTVGGY